MLMTCVHTLSKKAVSWDTTMVVTGLVLSFLRPRMYSPNHDALSTSRCPVGSSRRRISAHISMARTRPSFIFQPPDKCPISLLSWCLSKPKLRKAATTFFLEICIACIVSSANIYSSGVHSHSGSFSPMPCSTKAVTSSVFGGKPSTCSLLMARKTVLLPQSLGPQRP
mmetsp:Transcript_105528/g.308588  ORF Transcript_105528/g.308588 Transcript_105528/m.308588 type:complete len:168 (-) Transcript_105528:2996-3499(-)